MLSFLLHGVGRTVIRILADAWRALARIRIQLPTSCPEEALFRTDALGLMRSGP
jgi:hypothetical protein